MIKAIIFDLGNVLIDISYESFYQGFARATGISITQILENPPMDLVNEFMKGNLDGANFHSQMCQHFQISLHANTFKRLWPKVLVSQKEDVAEIVTGLHEKYQLAMLSNTDPWHFEYCQHNFPIVNTFNITFLSFNVRMLKPDTEFFLLAANQLHVKPEQCIFIDDLEENVTSAQAVGFNIVHFKNSDQLLEEFKKLDINPFSSNEAKG